MREDKSFQIYSRDLLESWCSDRANELKKAFISGNDAPPIQRKTHCALCGEKLAVHSYAKGQEEVKARIAEYCAIAGSLGGLGFSKSLYFQRLQAAIEDLAKFWVYYRHVKKPDSDCILYVGAWDEILSRIKKAPETFDYSHQAAATAADDNPTGGRQHIVKVREIERALNIVADAAYITPYQQRTVHVPTLVEVVHTHAPEFAVQRETAIRSLGGRGETIWSSRHLRAAPWRLEMRDAEGVILQGDSKMAAFREMRRLATHGDKNIEQFTFGNPVHPRVIHHMLTTGQTRQSIHIPGLRLLIALEADDKEYIVGRPTMGRDHAERALLCGYEKYELVEGLL